MEPIEHLHIGYGRHESSDLSHHAQQFFSEKKIKNEPKSDNTSH